MGKIGVPSGDPDLDLVRLQRRVEEIDRRSSSAGNTAALAEAMLTMPRGVARPPAVRTAGISGIGTSFVGVLDLTVPVRAERQLLVSARHGCRLDGDPWSIIASRITYTFGTTTPPAPTSGAGLLVEVPTYLPGGGFGLAAVVDEWLTVPADGVLRVALWVRGLGAGRVFGVDAGGGAACWLAVTDLGA